MSRGKAATATVPTRLPLSRERVLQAAIRLADEGGIGSLSMRRLAEELGIEAMSLYHYFANKDGLLAAMLDVVVGEFDVSGGTGDWRTTIRQSAVSAHEVLMRHRWAAGLMMSLTGVAFARLRFMESLLRRLREAGFSPELTHHAYHALDSHIIGSTLWEAGYSAQRFSAADARRFLATIPADEYRYLLEHAEQHFSRSKVVDVTEFEFGLDLILDGLERVRAGGPRAGASGNRRS